MDEKKLTDEEIVKALENCLYGDYKTKCKGCRYDESKHYCQDMDKDALNLIRRLQAEKDNAKYTAESLHKTIAEQKSEIERLTEERNAYIVELNSVEEANTYANRFLTEYKEKNAELQKQADKSFERGVKVAVEKMRAYLPPRDVDDYPDAIPSHWQLDEVLRQLIGNK